MNRFLYSLAISVCISFIFGWTYVIAQPNSVDLKDGGGLLISSHASITDAYGAIPGSVTQAYIIEITSAYNGSSETFPIQITNRGGTSLTNTITLRPAAGNSGASITTSINNNPVINLNNSLFFILDGRPGGVGDSANLLIENTITSGTSSNTINMTNASSNNVIRYCKIKNNTQSTAGPRALIFGASTTTGNNDNIVEFNHIIGGRSGIGMVGSTSIPNMDNIIRFNKIYDFGFAGIWMLSNGESTTIEGNEIYQTTGVNTSGVSGINIASSGMGGINNIIKNKIYNIQHISTSTSASVRGITGSNATGGTLNIINNFIALPLDNQNTASTYGIQISGTTEFVCNIIYNSIRIGGNQTGGTAGNVVSAGIVKTASGAGIVYNQKNNICVNNRSGGTSGVFHTGSFVNNLNGVLDVDYNAYFADGATGAFHAGWGTTLYNVLGDYKTAANPHEQNAIFKNVNFVSLIDLHLTGASIADIDLAALPIAGITDDIDGDVRDLVFPYKGADEANTPIPVELVSFSSSVNGNTVTLSWSTASEVNNYGFEVERNAESNGWVKAGFVAGSGTTTEQRSYSFTDNDMLPGRYSYRLKQIDMDGSFKYYNLPVSVDIETPKVYSLSQNYPNPFNPSTVINYQVPVDGKVTIKVFDILGNEVVTLLDEERAAGSYNVEFNASQLPSNVYFYRMQSGNFIEVKKMTLIK